MYHRKPERECSGEVIEPKIELSMLHYQIFKRSNEPSHDKEYLLCKFSYTSKVYFFWVLFQNFTILPVTSTHIFEIVCCIRKYKEILVQNVQILK